MKKIYYLLALLLINSRFTFSQVVINEYSCSNITGIQSAGDRDDWIEFYNPTASAVNLTGYYLSDKQNNPTKWQFPAGVSIPANGYLLVFCSGRDAVIAPGVHTNFRLNQTEPENIVFSNPSGTILENITLTPTQKDHSRGRTTDGASTWSLFITPTPGVANANAQQDYVARPVMSINAGFYTGAQSVSITCSTPGAEIRYTTDGSDPTPSSTLYTAPVNIATTTVLRARAFLASAPPSFIESNTYFINVNHTVPVVSIFGSDVGTLFAGSQGDPDAVVEYFDANKQFKTEAAGQANKHGNDSWAYSQRGVDFITRDQFGYSYALKHKFFPTSNRKNYQRIILKAAACDNYPFAPGNPAHIRDAYIHTLSDLGNLKLDERRSIFCIVYMNGQYWGVYDLREKADDKDYTSYYYDQDEKYNDATEYIQYIKTWGGTWNEYGGAQSSADWNTLRNFIMNNNTALPANWNYVDSLLNWKSLIDYFCVNSYTVNKDWLNWNTAWWRGLNPLGDKKKWRYVLWDLDATFGHYVNFTGIPDISPAADPCNAENLPNPGGQGHTDIMSKLMENPTFKQYYISRYADLANTTFSCAYMLHVLDSMVAVIDPEMQAHITKWGGSYATWLNNVQMIRDFINQRCVQFAQGMIDCYNLTGPYNITILVDPPNSGTVDINSIHLENFPWTGTYYGGIETLLKADAYGGWEFDYWEIASTPLPNEKDSSITTTFAANDVIVAHFKQPAGAALPNAFSPNGDGINDVLYVLGENIVGLNLSIYNRWGEKIFNTTSQSVGWDGTYKGQKLNSGVYTYKLYVILSDGTEINQSGNITLMR